jgi:outer membrane protein, heavy metal efflux system
MRLLHKLTGLLVLGTALLSALPAAAEPVASCSPVTRENVAACVVKASAAVRADREAMAAATGRQTAAAPWFPSNPTLSVTLARRGGTENRGDTLNYTAALSQELEVAGSRAARRRAADADVEARGHEWVATARRAAADGYLAWFELLAARDAVRVARLLEGTAQQIARVTKGRADAGVASPLDAELADAASLRVTQARLDAERQERADTARLASLLGRDPTRESVAATGELEPLAPNGKLEDVMHAATAEIASRRPELRALASDQRAWEARAEAFRRARVPNLSLQLFAQNDGYNERVLGAGLMVPIPLPQPIGHFYTGEIREAEALARQTTARRELLVRELGTELATAVAAYESRRSEVALYTEERATRSERMLSEIGKEIEAGRLSVRDALLAQQQLIDVLRARVETRRALCLASVDLALAAGVALEGSR